VVHPRPPVPDADRAYPRRQADPRRSLHPDSAHRRGCPGVAASKTTSVWAHFGRVTDIVLFVVVVGGVTLALGKVPLGTRNPLRVIFGALRAYSVPSAGRYRGSPAKTPQPCRTRVRPAIDTSPPPARSAAVARSVPAELTPIQDALSRKVPA
jgi:hypothetical protein